MSYFSTYPDTSPISVFTKPEKAHHSTLFLCPLFRGKVTVSIPSLNGIRIATQPLGDNRKRTRLRGLIVVAL